jgi:Tfp pilus assembly protein PilF
MFARRMFVLLSVVALVYAFCAGLRTVQDFDLGWQMATGRWIVQHHSVPKVDVLSYTMQGQPWTYPVGAGLVFYLAYQLGGFALISWIGAAACVGTVALLLRRNTAAGAAIAILAVPLIAARTTPRAEMFGIVLFAAFLSLLWEDYQTGKARLWLLPLLMFAWVNLHFGFASGLALIVAYVAAELFEFVLGVERRRIVSQRLRRASPWLMATVLVTLVNPWGWGLYRALILQQKANAQQQLWISEWAPVPVNWATISHALLPRNSGGAIYLLLAVAVIAGAIALFRGHWTAAILLLGATYPAVHAVRMGAIFGCVVVVAGGPQWSALLSSLGERLRPPRVRSAVAGVAATCLIALAALCCFDLVTNRHYYSVGDEATFGAGLCSWFPTGAAEFIAQQKLPGQILNTYAAGGYLTWTLGPDRLVYIDGRDTLYGPTGLARHSQLMFASPDSAPWQEEVNRYHINTVVIALARYDGLPPSLLRELCGSPTWRPVYLDEKSAVFVRQSPETAALVLRFPVNCATAPLPAVTDNRRGAAFNQWANTAITLAALERNGEAQAAYQKAFAIYPDEAFLRRNYADLLFAMGKMDESEKEYLNAIALQPSADTWGALARSYLKRGRQLAAADAMEHEAEFSPRPYLTWNDLGYLYLQLNQPEKAGSAFDKAAHSTPSALKAADNGFFEFKVAQGRAAAADALGNLDRAIVYQEEAANLEPNVPAPWRRLAKMYERAGRSEDANRARQHAAEVEKQPQH